MPKYSVLKNKTNSDFSKFVLFPFGGERGIMNPCLRQWSCKSFWQPAQTMHVAPRRVAYARVQIGRVFTIKAKGRILRFSLWLLWRRERDSNPRVRQHKLISSQPRYDHFDISPYEILISYGADIERRGTSRIHFVFAQRILAAGEISLHMKCAFYQHGLYYNTPFSKMQELFEKNIKNPDKNVLVLVRLIAPL